MSFPDAIAIKLDAYTLFCHQFLVHLSALNDATRADTRLSADACRSRFDQSLHQFFYEAAPMDLAQAADELGDVLQGRVALFRAQNLQAAVVFDRVIEAAQAAVPTWSYQQDIEGYHQQGRQLARHFYCDSPWPVTQARLGREAQLQFYGDEEPRPLKGTFGYHPTPAAYRERNNVILVRFGFNYDLGLYLAYPYLFMHEYVSHIFALDHSNERFNDGWLLHAADGFLIRHGWSLDLRPKLIREQIAAFGEHLYGQLLPISRQACRFARDFDGWLNDEARFWAIAWELAAFEPRTDESVFWPNKLINRLEEEFEHNRPLLRRKIQASSSLRALFAALAPI